MTPLEAAADQAVWCHLFNTDVVPPRSAIRRYERSQLAPNVALYSADAGARTLVIGFCGNRGRLLMPIAVMLQNMDERLYDVLILSDPRNAHYDQGIGDFADSLPSLAARLERIAGRRGYTALATYGTSMGGFPALRMGGLLGANRAVSCGGRQPWHVNRLRKGEPAINAFDLICECRKATAAPSYLLFSNGNEADARAAARIAAIVRESTLVSIQCKEHNFPIRIFSNGNLADYCGQIFDVEREPNVAALAALAA